MISSFRPIVIYIFFIATVLNCSSNDDSGTLNVDITGEWKLIQARIFNFSGMAFIDYSQENIVYNFTSNGELVVTGGDNAGYPNGMYNYIFELDYLSNSENPDGQQIPIVKIESTKWTHILENDEMILGTSYVDGPDLVFIRK